MQEGRREHKYGEKRNGGYKKHSMELLEKKNALSEIKYTR